MVSPPDRNTTTREFHFTEQDFQRVRKLIYDHAGISLSDSKMDMVYSRLGRRLRATGLSNFREYLSLLEKNDAAEWEAFVNSLTTNLTSFFREPHHFPILADHIRKIRQRQPIQLWCNAASTGEEPYTMAMTMVDVFGSYTPPVQILATDLDTHVLKTAQAGIYGADRVEKLPKDILQRFFVEAPGGSPGQMQVRKELRKMITFRQLNLLDANWLIRGPFDAVFCRNVMIYFDKATQHKILQKLVPVMRSDALLFAGHSESFQHAADLFHIQGRTVYTIAEQARALAIPAASVYVRP
ncbi:MAG: CheR family methyltransferase [Methylophilaceae bacterium]|nr:CheR family methyltransferase [Methylophilaceae bacterium]